ncbi:MAG: signal peptide peptidase SppA [Methylomonas sp.]|nr:MAG: signal peptide peptidase SppA [Methylomonas sp.]PPD27146.1 MAG: signal peptide peptidase SppA [Methylomonas sp.]PPD39101.1 MAG: signal peptide peptidase SppA [Methylomonas sp.]PPD42329.1 MAG: signal peptide peptidase SppA [Methylomonas sp.]PPD55036.1 MAG: signal peptide peptidase SppA [Methylomonas sp.]
MLTFAYLAVILWIIALPTIESDMVANKPHIAVIDVKGMIAEGESANAEVMIQGLRNAVKDKNTKGIVLNINSPGGSAVQAAYVYDEIRRQKQKRPDLPIYAVVGDICASGGYYIAAASDKIFVSPASIIGSIGAVMNSFGFAQALEKLGVERRTLAAGEHKAMLDPFAPLKPQEAEHMQTMLNQVHQQFINAVKQGRGDRLKQSPELFSGLVWSGEASIDMGLADGFGSVDSVAREVVGVDEKINFTPKERLLDRLAGRVGTAFAGVLAMVAKNISHELSF